jgi:hypothetical protein
VWSREPDAPPLALPLALPLAHLVGAMRRQQSFMENMLARRDAMGSVAYLRASVDRYVRFLGLMRQHPGTMLVPTLAVDLIWHTHQMIPHRYAKVTKALAGRFVNHDDNLDDDDLSEDLAQTEKLWEQAYGEAYLSGRNKTLRSPKAAQCGLAVVLLAACALLASPSQQQAAAGILSATAASTRRQMQSGDCDTDQYHISNFENAYYSLSPTGTSTTAETIIECKRKPSLPSSNPACSS